MTTLVTGGAGYIGSHVVLSLLDRGESVVVLDNLVTGFRAAVPSGATLVVGDIADRDLLKEIFKTHKVRTVMHFAGSTVVPESVSDPLKYYGNNTVKSSVLIDECQKGGIKEFVFSSTAAVYDAADGKPISEDVPLQPASPYASSKLMTEGMLRDVSIAFPDFRYLALRYFNVAGADPQGRAGQSSLNATHLIKVACQAALGLRPKLEVFGNDYATPDGTCIRDYIHVSDLADAHLSALDYLRQGAQSSVYNCGYGRGFSVLEVIETVKQESGCDGLPVDIVGRRPGDSVAVVADSSRLRRDLGWTPRYDDLGLIVRTAYAWEKQCLQKQAG